MRPLITAACFLLAATPSFAQIASGTYQPSSGSPVAWRINEHNTLLWGEQPYLPVGVRIGSSSAEISAAAKAGVKDVIIELPPTGAGWADALKALESGGMRYLLAIDSLMPSAKGFAVQPEAYRISGITQDRHVEFPLPEATSALAMLVTERDRTIQWSQRVSISDGKFNLDVKAPNQLDHVLLVYPEESDATHTDYWEGFDSHRDVLLTTLERNKPGPGLRGIVNPLGKLFRPVSTLTRFVPESPYFRMELKTYLQQRYHNLNTAERSWAMGTNDIDNFDALCRLVPLWSGSRGVEQLWDPATDRLYQSESKRSAVWSDIDAVINAAASKRFERLVPAVQRVVDVPVVQEWTGWIAPFEAATPAIAGIGLSAQGKGTDGLLQSGSRAASSLLRWKSPGWLLATDVDWQGTPEDLGTSVDDLAALGARGWFYRTASLPLMASIGAENLKRGADASFSQWSPSAVFFPENALNPAHPARLPGGKIWLPSPADGNRLDLGPDFNAYRYSDGNLYTTVIWTTHGEDRVKLRMSAPKKATFTTMDGSDPKLKAIKNGVEVTLSEIPLMITGTDETPIPELAWFATVSRYAQLLAFEQKLSHVDSEDQYYLKASLEAFDRDPGSTFGVLRQQFVRLNQKLGRFTWIEAEHTGSTTFSERAAASGCSGGANLALHTPVATDPRGFFADYVVPVRTTEEQDVWIAARVSPELRSGITLQNSDQILKPEGDPTGFYSSGFAWYKLGRVQLKGHNIKMTLRVIAPEGADMAVDAILFTPGGFQPSGINMPDAIPFITAPVKTKRKG